MISRRGASIVGAIAVAVLIAGGALTLTLSGDDGPSRSSGEDPAESGPSRQEIAVVAREAGVGGPIRPELPEVDDREAVAAFLDADGARLIAVHSSLADLLANDEPTKTDCEAVAAELDDLFVPAELYAVAGDVPDPATSELFVNLAASTNRFLAACRDGDEVLRGELAYQWVLVDRRLEDLDTA